MSWTAGHPPSAQACSKSPEPGRDHQRPSRGPLPGGAAMTEGRGPSKPEKPRSKVGREKGAAGSVSGRPVEGGGGQPGLTWLELVGAGLGGHPSGNVGPAGALGVWSQAAGFKSPLLRLLWCGLGQVAVPLRAGLACRQLVMQSLAQMQREDPALPTVGGPQPSHTGPPRLWAWPGRTGLDWGARGLGGSRHGCEQRSTGPSAC